MLRTRGKRVVAEATDPGRAVRASHARRRSELMFRARQVANLGGFMSGVNNNGAHSANGDHGDVHRHRAGRRQRRRVLGRLLYAELRADGDYYYSVTIPSLIVATYGGGTGLPPSASAWSCSAATATGKVRKLAEIVAATVLCGELSLGSAIVAEEWVDAHDLLGRNRP